MKAIYGKHVRGELDSQMAQHFPEFEPLSLRLSKEQRKQVTLFPGSRLYRCAVGKHLHLFIHMIPHQRQERFMLEVGWSTRGRFPHELSSTTTFIKPGRDELDEDEYLVDFNELYHRKYHHGFLGWDVWTCSLEFPTLDLSRANDLKYKEAYQAQIQAWKAVFVEEDARAITEAEAHDRARRAVLQCIKDIKDIVAPYFRDLIQRKTVAHPQ